MRDISAKREPLGAFGRSQRGAAAVEFGLLMPLLLIMLLGVIELGRALYHYSILAKAVEDGGRYLSRQRAYFTGGIAEDSAQWQTVQDRVGALVTCGYVGDSTTITAANCTPPLLSYGSTRPTISITEQRLVGDVTYAGTPYTLKGPQAYSGSADVPRFTVAASIPYNPLIFPGFGLESLQLRAQVQVRVIGG